MSLKPTVIEGFLAEHRVPAAAQAALGVVAAVAVGGLFAGMPLTDMLICGLVAGGGVGLICAVGGCLFDGLGASVGDKDRPRHAPRVARVRCGAETVSDWRAEFGSRT